MRGSHWGAGSTGREGGGSHQGLRSSAPAGPEPRARGDVRRPRGRGPHARGAAQPTARPAEAARARPGGAAGRPSQRPEQRPSFPSSDGWTPGRQLQAHGHLRGAGRLAGEGHGGPSLHFRKGPDGTRTRARPAPPPNLPLSAPRPERPRALSTPDLPPGAVTRPRPSGESRRRAPPRAAPPRPTSPMPRHRVGRARAPRIPARRPPGRLRGGPARALTWPPDEAREGREQRTRRRALSHNARRGED